MKMAEYVEREALIAWLKRIQLKDLSDGRGLCRVIFEEDFKHAIRTLPDGAIADVAPVVRCRDCKHSYVTIGARCCSYGAFYDVAVPDDFFCAYGKREENNNEAGN